MQLLAAAFKSGVEHRERFDFRHLEQAPPDRRVTWPRRTAELEHQQSLAAILNAVVVRLGDARGAAVADFDKTPVGDCESNPRAG